MPCLEEAIQRGDEREFDALMRRLRHILSGGPYTQDEMNKRSLASEEKPS